MGSDSPRADSSAMAMNATVIVAGPALDVQKAVVLIEEMPLGGPVAGRPGAWRWTSEREDIVDRVIAHSMEFPDLVWDVEGETVDGFTKERVELGMTNGHGAYRRVDFGRPNKRIPVDVEYDAVDYEYLITDGRARLDRVIARREHDGALWTLDVTNYFWRV